MARSTTYIRKAHPSPTPPAAPLAVASAGTRRSRVQDADTTPPAGVEPTIQRPSIAPAATLPQPAAAPLNKQARIAAALRRPEGATLAELIEITGWLPHSVRGVLAGALKRKLGLTIDSRVEEGRGRVYRIVAATPVTPEPAKVTVPEPGPTAHELPPRRAKRRSAAAPAAAA